MTLYEDEMQILRWSDSSKSGASVTFALPDRDKLDAFIGKEGKRVACVLVEIGDDEKPAKQPLGPKCQALVMWCKDPVFWEFLNERRGLLGFEAVNHESKAAEFVKAYLSIKSRKEVDDEGVLVRFGQMIQGPWQKYCLARGK